jgi:L-asparaginase
MVTIALGDDDVLVDGVTEHVQGLVVPAFGIGHVPAGTVTSLATLAACMPVVLASRIGAGPVHATPTAFLARRRTCWPTG